MIRQTYDPLRAPEPAAWLALDEDERIRLVEECHRKVKMELPDPRVHATFHVIVENQIAEGLDPVVRTLQRLTHEGLDRHDAIHAIGCVLIDHLQDVLSGAMTKSENESRYFARVEKLTSKRWLRGKW
ncbi:MAG: hypothetical protein A3H91_01990 [Gammaproteobacteria bacterium RIFCSPLOWO2_02_FULL_61_13]|nr:MAG: hypothetical protein A3H91_01990 [Gammaproteobacteria bacterium RIFCSPLOWO2_02_FULL_61_13]